MTWKACAFEVASRLRIFFEKQLLEASLVLCLVETSLSLSLLAMLCILVDSQL